MCKIHRKLPPGHILVFLTGKSEIIRVQKRLQKILIQAKNGSKGRPDSDNDDLASLAMSDLDSDDDYDKLSKSSDSSVSSEESIHSDTQQDVVILPLHSMLASSTQTKLFSTAANTSHRLIILSTNIAETSLTIPNVKYGTFSSFLKCSHTAY